MTIIDGIELDVYTRNYTKEAIQHNQLIDNVLHVVMVVSNPCRFLRRYSLARQFMLRMEREPNIKLYVVELCYKDQKYILTQKRNPRHLQLRTNVPLWHKENMINIGIKKLLPSDWKAVAWIDADIEFESNTWASDTLKILNGHSDIVQLFSHAIDMDASELTMSVFNSGGYQHEKGNPYKQGINYWHPGFAWACTRKAYEQMGQLYQQGILGSGDNIMMMSLIQNVHKAINDDNTPGYLQTAYEFQERVKGLRFGYVPGVIRHYFHGQKVNRKYRERWQILVEHQYDPHKDLLTDENGLLIPSELCPSKLLEDIMKYFEQRNEDEFFISN
jgi:hypothetical protein